MNIVNTTELTKNARMFLLNEFKKKNQNYLLIDDDKIKKSLLDSNLIETNMNADCLCFKLTENGIKYCERQIEINNKDKKDNFIQWISLSLSAIAILLSIISLGIQFMSYRNEQIDIKSETADISDEIIDNVITIDNGSE